VQNSAVYINKNCANSKITIRNQTGTIFLFRLTSLRLLRNVKKQFTADYLKNICEPSGSYSFVDIINLILDFEHPKFIVCFLFLW